MNEFSFNFAPLGIPGNPLDGSPMGMDTVRPRKYWDKGTRSPLQAPNRMESFGMQGFGGVPAGRQLPQFPEQLLVPDVVSATDPAFSMRPEVKAFLEGLSKVPAASPVGDSPWTQWRSKDRTKLLRKSELLSGLNNVGLDLPYKDQGEQVDA